MLLFALRAQVAEDFQLRRARLIAFAELSEVSGPFLSFDFVLHNHSPFNADDFCQYSQRPAIRCGCKRQLLGGGPASVEVRAFFIQPLMRLSRSDSLIIFRSSYCP